jgi:hypothetical protein
VKIVCSVSLTASCQNIAGPCGPPPLNEEGEQEGKDEGEGRQEEEENEEREDKKREKKKRKTKKKMKKKKTRKRKRKKKKKKKKEKMEEKKKKKKTVCHPPAADYTPPQLKAQEEPPARERMGQKTPSSSINRPAQGMG